MADPDALVPAWENGRLRPMPKLEVHRRGLRHRAVSVFVLEAGDDATLIQRRAMNKYHTPGLWANACCTHPHWDEDPADCARRRLEQELGLTGLDPVHRGRVEYRADVGGGMIEHEVVDLFVALSSANTSLAPDPAEVMDTAWIGVPDLVARVAHDPGAFTPWLSIYLADHGTAIFGQPAART